LHKKIYNVIKEQYLQKKGHLSILWYPKISTQEDLNREISRACWYLNPISHKLENIHFLVDLSVNIEDFQVPIYADTSIQSIYINLYSKFSFNSKKFKVYDVVFNWKNIYEGKRHFQKKFFNIDFKLNQFEANHMLTLSKLLLEKKERKENKKKLISHLTLLKQEKYNDVYLIGSGPTLDVSKMKHDSLIIICNSVVKDIELLKKISPKIIVATDAVFHSGYSKYAASFRKALILAFDTFSELYFYVPIRDYNVYISNLPKVYKKRIIAINTSNKKKYNFDILKKSYIRSTSNVLTFFMLPLAGTLCKNITLTGFDGKEKSDKDIFWRYNSKTQFHESMKYTVMAHAAFYKVDYDLYYKNHCNELSEMIQKMRKEEINFCYSGDTNISVLQLMRQV